MLLYCSSDIILVFNFRTTGKAYHVTFRVTIILAHLFLGIRPECLTHFNEACWNLMEQCWAAEPAERPLLGNVQPQLEHIYRSAKFEANQGKFSCSPNSIGFYDYQKEECYNHSYINFREY